MILSLFFSKSHREFTHSSDLNQIPIEIPFFEVMNVTTFYGLCQTSKSEAAMDLLVLAQHGSNKEARAALMLGSQRYDAGLQEKVDILLMVRENPAITSWGW